MAHRQRFDRRFGFRKTDPVKMEILDSVEPEEVPYDEALSARPGQWSDLVARTIADRQQNKVTVVKFDSRDEVKRMRNGVAEYYRKRGLRLVPIIVDDVGGSVRVYMELKSRDLENGRS